MILTLNRLTERLLHLASIFSYENRRVLEPKSFKQYSEEAQHLKMIKAAKKRERQPLTTH